jgi:predicted GIY-YIG superfamily endonuclease
MSNQSPGYVYFLRFTEPISAGHTTQHYIGWASDLANRVETHRERPDARLLQVAKERGINFEVARVWKGSREDERYLKNLKAGHRLYSGRRVERLAERELTPRQIEKLLTLPF